MKPSSVRGPIRTPKARTTAKPQPRRLRSLNTLRELYKIEEEERLHDVGYDVVFKLKPEYENDRRIRKTLPLHRVVYIGMVEPRFFEDEAFQALAESF
jgi:hypothetical protein